MVGRMQGCACREWVRAMPVRRSNDGRWRYREIDATHTPNVTAPEALLKLILEMTA